MTLKTLEKKMTNRFNRNRPQNAASCMIPWLAAEVSQQFVMRLLRSSVKNFIQQRLNGEQSDQVQVIIDVSNANNETQLIASGSKLVEEIFGKESVQSFADDGVSYFVSHGARSFTPTDSITAKL